MASETVYTTYNMTFRGIRGAYKETPRIINIDMPGCCPYVGLCLLTSASYSLKYHTDLREKTGRSSWGCAGGSNLHGCSSYKRLKKEGYP